MLSDHRTKMIIIFYVCRHSRHHTVSCIINQIMCLALVDWITHTKTWKKWNIVLLLSMCYHDLQKEILYRHKRHTHRYYIFYTTKYWKNGYPYGGYILYTRTLYTVNNYKHSSFFIPHREFKNIFNKFATHYTE